MISVILISLCLSAIFFTIKCIFLLILMNLIIIIILYVGQRYTTEIFKRWIQQCSCTKTDITPLALLIIRFLTRETIAGVLLFMFLKLIYYVSN